MALVAKSPSMPPPPPPLAVRRASTSSSVASSSKPMRPPPTILKDTSSSSGKVFAKPTKEWTIPDKAKPGRKVSVDEPGNSRQSQNRISQRAHRARRTDYIQTLEDRIKQYEADEIHSNVRLQEVARALKTDNERLKRENESLLAAQAEHEGQRESWLLERKALEAALAAAQQGRIVPAVSITSIVSAKPARQIVSPPTLPRRPASLKKPLSCPICPDPDPDCPCQQQYTQPASGSPARLAGTSSEKVSPDPSTHLDVLTLAAERVDETTGSCGLCHSREDCLCAIVNPSEGDLSPPSSSRNVHLESAQHASDDCGLCTNGPFCACKSSTTAYNAGSTTIMSVTASRTAAVPLRRTAGPSSVKRPIWKVSSAGPTVNEAVCSGDPANCDACRNDSFGQEFCSNLFSRAFQPATHKPCAACPGDCMSIKSLLNEPSRSSTSLRGSTKTGAETMTPDKVWQTLKAHPNAKTANLALLAEVVASRTQCFGPRAGSPPQSEGLGSAQVDPMDPDKRSLRVETSAVQDALRLLDAESGDERGIKRRKLEA